MIDMSDAAAAAALMLSIVVGGVTLHVWRKLRSAHWRLHQLERGRIERDRQLTQLSRSACLAIARQQCPDLNGEIRCHAQHGEELYLWERLDWKRQGVFIEIGAYDGVSFSNSLFFEKIGWRGLLIEAHPELMDMCRENRPDAEIIHAALGEQNGGTVTFSMVRGARGLDSLSFASTTDHHRRRVGLRGGHLETAEVPARSLRSVLQEHGVTDVDWISIDVEGAELSVLKGSSLASIRPKLILVEDNTAGKDSSVAGFLARHGYHKELSIGCNDLYSPINGI